MKLKEDADPLIIALLITLLLWLLLMPLTLEEPYWLLSLLR